MPDPNDPKNEPIGSALVREDASFVDLVEEFLAELPHRLDDLRQASDASDWATIKGLAHQLKGSGGGYGYPALTELAARYETQAANAQVDACRVSLTELEALVARLVVQT